MIEILSDRNRKILEAVIKDYILSAEPVGSRTISKKYPLSLSPATIRNAMADLEEMGLLSQPHTSAGRIPTDKGFRFYVDSLLEVRKLTSFEKEQILKQYSESRLEFKELMKETSRVLSMLSQYAGFVLAPKFTAAVLKHIEFVKLRERQILVILVSQSGMVQNRLLDAGQDFSQHELEKISNYLDSILSGLTLDEARERIVEEMKREKVLYDQLMVNALRLSQAAFEGEEDRTLYIDGTMNILNQPEFADIEKIKSIYVALEEKSTIVTLLEKVVDAKGIQVFIGAENSFEGIQDCSLITSIYSRGSCTLGALGIIGPTRMNYSRVIPLVDYTARLIGMFMEKGLEILEEKI